MIEKRKIGAKDTTFIGVSQYLLAVLSRKTSSIISLVYAEADVANHPTKYVYG